MKKQIVFTIALIVGSSLLAAESGSKQEVIAAAKKLGDKANYSWSTTVVVPEGARFRPGPTEGKTEKDGLTDVSMKFGDNTTRAVMKGEKFAISSPDGGWQSAADLENEQGQGRFRAMFVRSFKAPAAQAAELAEFTKELKKEGDAYSGPLTEEGAKTLLTFRRRAGGEGPTVTNPQGSAKFWVKDGVITKYEFKVKGTVTFNNNDMETDRTTTVEIKDVGTTKMDVPEEAKKKLS
jgi:hypothetical protein